MSRPVVHAPNVTGGSFLLGDTEPQSIFTPEDLTEEHRAIGRTVDEFWLREVEPNLPAIHRKEPGVLPRLLRRAAALGLTAMSIPEADGGLGLDLASVMVAEESLARDASYAVTHGGQAGIGVWPLAFFGTREQKAKYLPRLASAEMIAAYALTEPHAGSDALAIRTSARLADERTHYVLSGQKVWITNGGIADLFVVFAKVDGEQFTAFLVERAFPGVTTGAEEQKVGLDGSSTTALFLDQVKVPIDNVLGEIGRGHTIAFNALNLGRLKIGPYAAGASKDVLRICLAYAVSRKAFGMPIGRLGAIRHKLAEMAVRVFATESMAWRVVGLIEAAQATLARGTSSELDAVHAFAVECSIVKVYASEALAFVTDEGVQIHGGYGYHNEYPVARAYRDARVYRIFEGTNEINRLVIAGTLLKRAARGLLDLFAAVDKVEQVGGETSDRDALGASKVVFLLAVGAARAEFGAALEKQQEIVTALSDMAIDIFAFESSVLRSRKLAASGHGANAEEMTAVLAIESLRRIEMAARTVAGACERSEGLRRAARRLADYDGANAVQLRQRIAERLLEQGRY